MTGSNPRDPAARPPRGATAFHTIALIALLGASSAPTPLYHVYQERFGFSPGMLTIIFGVYAFSLLVALTTVGSLSDFIGRRPVICAALLLEAIAMLAFVRASSVETLIAARTLQGFATGAATSAIGAAVIDVDKARGPLVNAVSPLLGMGLGALGASALVEFAPWPMQLVYVILGAVFTLQAATVWLMPETGRVRPGWLAALAPRVSVPKQARSALLVVSPINIAVWALGGFYLSLAPSLIRAATGLSSALIGGFVVCALTMSGAAAIAVLRRQAPPAILTFGTLGLGAGMAIILYGVHAGAPWLLLLGTVIAGFGHGSSFLGGLSTVMPLAKADERAGLLAAIYVESYLAFSLPAIAAGFAAQRIGLIETTNLYGGCIIALAAVGFLANRRTRAAARA